MSFSESWDRGLELPQRGLFCNNDFKKITNLGMNCTCVYYLKSINKKVNVNY